MASAVRDAIVVVGPGDARRAIAGVPLIERTVRALERTEFERCTLIGEDIPPLRTRLRIERAPTLRACPDAALRFVVGPGVVLDAALVRDVVSRAHTGEVIEVARDGVHVRVAPGTRLLERSAVTAPPTCGVLASATAPGRAVEQALLRGLENPRDGYLDHLIHRRLSRLLTRWLLRTPLTPNMVTLLGILVGVAGGLLLGAPGAGGVAIGVGCLLLSGVLDCCDGELARLRFAESHLGHVLDVTGDTLVHGAVLAGIVSHLVRSGTVPSAAVLGGLAVGVLGAFAAITWSEATEARRHRIDAWENGVLERILSPLSTRDWHLFVVVFALGGRLDLLLAGGAVGAHVFWMLVTVLVVRVLRRSPAVVP